MNASPKYVPPTSQLDDRIIAAVRAIGTSANDAALRQAVDCSNELLIPLAIQRLQRSGRLRVHLLGHYEVVDDPPPEFPDRAEILAKLGDAAPSAAPEPDKEPEPQLSTQETNMATTQKCAGECGQTMRAIPEIFGKDSRTELGVGKTCSKCKAKKISEGKTKGNGAKPASKKTTSLVPASAPAIADVDELVIPAGGAITCRAIGAGIATSFVIQQDKDQIAASYAQLQALRDWASLQLKKAAA